MTGVFSLLVTVMLAQAPGAVAPDLATARALYASAAYEDALSHLSTIKDLALTPQVEQYRALCLLALGRTGDAELALKHIVTANPFYQMTDADVSPRLVAMYREVRARALPGVAKDLYGRAKAQFDAKAHAEAARMFADVLAIVQDKDVAEDSDLADLGMLADGFKKLAEAAMAPKEPPAPVPAPPPPPVSTPKAPAAPAIYSVEDAGVVPPGDIERRLPAWDASNRAIAATAKRGILEVVINERGTVESAVLRASVSPYYDAQLLEAAKKWRFKPATKDGKPVKFRRLFAIQLN